jgi:hypothetical protein
MAGFTGPLSNNALIGNYFQLQIDKIPNVVWFCQSANIPGIKLGEFEQPTTLSHPIRSPVGAIRFDDLDLIFRVDENLKNWLEIHNWLKEMSNYTNDTSFMKPWNQQRSYGVLKVTSSSYRPKIEVKFSALFPISLGGIQFSTVDSDSKEMIAAVKFAYSDYDVRILETL